MKRLVLASLLVACGTEEKKDPNVCEGSSCSVTVTVNPLQISVDGETYTDSEIFYGKHLEKIQTEAEKNYPDLNVKLQATIGLTDLSNSLTYFVYNESYTGKQTHSFFLLDKTFKNKLFNVMATKRIDILLQDANGETKHQWCFNFKGTNSFINDEKVFVAINDWTTSLTKYKCQTIDGQTLGIPKSKTTDKSTSTAINTTVNTLPKEQTNEQLP